MEEYICFQNSPFKTDTCPDALPYLSSDFFQIRSQAGFSPQKCQTNLVPAPVSKAPRIERLL